MLVESTMESSAAMTAAAEIRLLPYDPERKPEIVELLNAALEQKTVGARDQAYWDWKHERNPFGQSLLLMAECDGKLVGLRAFMRWEFATTQGVISAAKPVDSVTHPDYQRRGIFSRLTREACEVAREQGVQFLFNTPNHNSKPGYLKLGWQEVAALPMFMKPLRPVSAAWRVARWKFGLTTSPATGSCFRETPDRAETVFRNDSRDFAQASWDSPGNRLATHRTLDFLRWRYCEHPHISYYVERVDDAAGMKGLLVYRTNMRLGLREIMIDDVFLADNAAATWNQLVQQLQARVDAEYLVAHAGMHSSLLPQLGQLGFRRVPRRQMTLVARRLQDEVSVDPTQAEHWLLGLGDIEGL